MSHFMQVCQYGFVHGQCRCIGPKNEIKVRCDNESHIPEGAYVPKHRLDVEPE